MNNIKKEVRNKIKEYSKESYFNNYVNSEFITTNGDANIFIKLDNKSSLFDDRSIDNQVSLENSVYEYLDDKSSVLNNDVQVNYYILGLNLNNEEKELVKNLFGEHYAIELYKIQKEYKRSRYKILKLLLFGFFALLIYLLLLHSFNIPLLEEVVAFIASLTIWEAFDCYIYDFVDIKKERENITQKLLADIYFDKKEDR